MKITSIKIDKTKLVNSAKSVGNAAWKVAKSEEALGALKIIAATVALIHAVEELRQTRNKIGFK